METRIPPRPALDARSVHARCVVCGRDNATGLGMEFTPQRDGSVSGTLCCGRRFAGYADRLHGGVIAMLLDGAMTHCLFAHGIDAVTAELTVRYTAPVDPAREVTVRGWIESTRRRRRVLSAALTQDGHVRATATAKFLDRP